MEAAILIAACARHGQHQSAHAVAYQQHCAKVWCCSIRRGNRGSHPVPSRRWQCLVALLRPFCPLTTTQPASSHADGAVCGVFGSLRQGRPPTIRNLGGIRREFRILDHIRPRKKDRRNYWAQCPACARANADKSQDNLAIQIADPRFYKCWAGCTKEDIRAALLARL